MGYVRSKHIKVVFDGDHPYAGLEISTKRLSIEDYKEVMKLGRLRVDGMDDEAFKAFRRPFEVFGEALVSWNLQDEDDDGEVVDVPATVDAILGDPVWVMPVIKAWMQAIVPPSEDLGKDSDGGETSPDSPASPAPPIPMEPLSPSPTS